MKILSFSNMKYEIYIKITEGGITPTNALFADIEATIKLGYN